MIEGISADFSVANHNIVMLGPGGPNAHLFYHADYHFHIMLERCLSLISSSDVSKHNVRHIGIYTSPTTLPSVELYSVLPTIVEVHLRIDILVTAEDDARLHLPHEEALRFVHVAGNPFLHSEIETKSPDSIFIKVYIYHKKNVK